MNKEDRELLEKYRAAQERNREYHKRYNAVPEHKEAAKLAHEKWNAAHSGEPLSPEQVEHQRAYHIQYNAVPEHKEAARLAHQRRDARIKELLAEAKAKGL
jgi:hypothetical protein